jgi:hypothetical protein
MGEQYVGIDLRRRHSAIMRLTLEGEVLEIVCMDNDSAALSLELAKTGPDSEATRHHRVGVTGVTPERGAPHSIQASAPFGR